MMTTVKTGIERLAHLDHPFLTHKRIGVITNPTGITSDFRSTIAVCAGLSDVTLTALFACEHGLYGQLQAGEHVSDLIDPTYQVPVYSLYGTTRKPTAEMLDQIDTMIFDIQDLGIRYYTFQSTLRYVMEACAEHGKSLLVLDRPNPLGGVRFEGGILDKGYESMVGTYTMLTCTGMTIGELALMMNETEKIGCQLDVITMDGWKREMEFADTGLPWMLPSPNIPTINSVRLYAGTCLFEGTNLSEGRGTTIPFEWIGAPWLQATELAARFNAHRLPGIHAHPVFMTPSFSKHQGELCAGVRLFITDTTTLRAAESGLILLHEIIRLHPEEFQWLKPPEGRTRYFIDLLTGNTDVRLQLGNDEGLQRILTEWHEETAQWETLRKPYLLYD